MEKQVVATAKAPGAIGPYSQGIKVGNLVFVSGCLPIDMATGQLSTAISLSKRGIRCATSPRFLKRLAAALTRWSKRRFSSKT